jgi:hypothetical protein
MNKRKQVNITLSLQQSEIANYQATLATAQGKTVMAFTFATVRFVGRLLYRCSFESVQLISA